MAEKQPEAPETQIKVIGVEDEIPDKDSKEGKSFLTLQERLKPIELELLQPMQVSDRTEPLTSLKIKAPSSKQIDETEGNLHGLCSKCVQGIKPKDLDLHGYDYIRLQNLLRHFLP